MKSDPMDDVSVTEQKWPPSHGPGSGKAAWVAFAHARAKNEQTLWSIIQDQSAAIRDLQAEVDLLRAQIEKRKPKGGRPKLADSRVAEIERDLAAGYSTRQIASRCAVSAMTVSRVAKRVAARNLTAGR